MNAKLLGYARWSVRDALPKALAPFALYLLTTGVPLWMLVGKTGLEAIRASDSMRQGAEMAYRSGLPLTILLSGLMVGAGFVSSDRDRGHVRFLFSTPIIAWQFYLMRFAIGVALFVACLALIPVAFGFVFFPVDILPVAQSAAVHAVLLGSLAMLCGALTKYDGSSLIVIAALSGMFQAAAKGGEVPQWMRLAAEVLPPVGAAGDLQSAWLAGAPIDTGDLSLVLGYALALLVTALFTIHRAPLVR